MPQKIDSAAARRRELDLLQTIPELLTHLLPEHADDEAFREYSRKENRWVSLTFGETEARVQRWREAFAALGLNRGDRCAMLLPNSIDAVCFDQAVLSVALVPVPLHAIDTAGSSALNLQDSGSRVLVTNTYLKWKGIRDSGIALTDLRLVVITSDDVKETEENGVIILPLATFLERGKGAELPPPPKTTDLAALVYTSGTTGRPKGVMLTHRNILCNVRAVLKTICPYPDDRWFSLLPLSHTFERTTTYYAGMGMGNTIVFARSIATLAADLKTVAPTVMMAVPRVYEQICSRVLKEIAKQPAWTRRLFDWTVEAGWRKFCRENGLPAEESARAFLDPIAQPILDRLVASKVREAFGKGNRLHAFVSGGAALGKNVAKTLLSLGIPIIQGYGITEHSPIIAVHKLGAVHPTTVGSALSNVEARIAENGELVVRSPSVMKGYWNMPEATAKVIDPDGWFHTGDVAEIYSDGQIKIKGRIKEIIVTSSGEKVPPADLEDAIASDPLFDQVLVIGENRPFIAAVAVPDKDEWSKLCAELKLDPRDPASYKAKAAKRAALKRIKAATANFPNYGVPRDVILSGSAWTIENGLMTPTLKLKRGPITARFEKQIEELYSTKG